MKTPTAPEPGSAYTSFCQQVMHFLATALNAHLTEPELRRAISAALTNWRAQGYPRNWVARARRDIMDAAGLNAAPVPAPARPGSGGGDSGKVTEDITMLRSDRRQGSAFTAAPGVSARWISYPDVFLFAPPPEELTLRAEGPGGGTCLGFNLKALAEALHVDVLSLLLSNQNCLLAVQIDPAPAVGGMRRTRYRFDLYGAKGGPLEFIVPSV